MTRCEIFFFVCNNCGHVVARKSDRQSDLPDCEQCLNGIEQLVTITAQHEGAVRVKLEVPT